MRKFVFLAVLIVGLGYLPAQAAPDFTDTNLPTMSSFKQTLSTSTGVLQLVTEVELRWKRNQPIQFHGAMIAPDFNKNPLQEPCEAIFYGSTPQGGNSRNILPNEKISERKDGEYTISAFRFTNNLIDGQSQNGRKFCRGEYRITAVYLTDETNRHKAILDNRLVNDPVPGVAMYQVAELWNQLPNVRPCPLEYPAGSKYGFTPLCDSIDPSSSRVTLSDALFAEAAAKASSLKAEAEAKAKAEAEAKAKAEAAKKKTTITCIKGKITKKVTAVNPKCPTGYKKK